MIKKHGNDQPERKKEIATIKSNTKRWAKDFKESPCIIENTIVFSCYWGTICIVDVSPGQSVEFRTESGWMYKDLYHRMLEIIRPPTDAEMNCFFKKGVT